MLRVREHIHRLDAFHFVSHVKQLQVSCLCCRIAADIDDALRVGKEDGVDDVLMHSGTWRVGNDGVGFAVLLDEVAVEDVFHITSKELGVLDAVYL